MSKATTGRTLEVLAALAVPALALTLAFLVTAGLLPGQAEDQAYVIGPAHVVLDVHPDGSYRIAEAIRWDFRSGSFSFVHREIDPFAMDSMSPVSVRSPGAVGLTLEEDDWDEGERELRWSFPERRQPLDLVLEYRLWGALEEVGDRNRIRWRTLGSDWDVPRENVSLEVRLPGSFVDSADSLTVEASPDRVSGSSADGWTLRWSRERLTGSSDLEVEVAFPKVMDGAAVGLRKPEAQALLGGLVLFLITVLGGAVLHHRWQGPRIPEGRGSGDPDLPPLEAAVLVHGTDREAQRGFASILLSLAAAGRLSFILEKDRESFGKPERVRVEERSVTEESHGGRREVDEEVERRILKEVGRHPHLQAFAGEGKEFRRAWLRQVRDRLLSLGLLEDRTARAIRHRWAGIGVLILTAAVVPAGLLVDPRLFALLGLTLGGGTGLLVISTARHPRSLDGARRRRALLDDLTRLREEVERAAEVDPARAAQTWIRELPRVVLDPVGWGGTVSTIEKGLKKADHATFRAPDWVDDRREKKEKGSEAYRAFRSTREVVGLVTGSAAPGSQAATATGAAVGAAAAAGGATAGGGGGGAG